MEQLVVLIRERQWENERWTDYYVVTNSENPEQNFRNAIREFLLTEEGIQQIKWSSEDYNWGDAVQTVPYEIWNKHQIRPVSEGDAVVVGNQVEIIVEQDEILIPDEYYEREEK